MILILGESLHAIKLLSNYDVILDHAHIFFLSEEKIAVRKIAKPGAVSISAGASTFATAKSDNSSN